MFRRGQSSGGGYSSLGYLFGSNDHPPPRAVSPNNRGPQQRSLEQPAKEQDNVGGYGSKESAYSSSTAISPDNERPAAGAVYHDERYDTSEGRFGRVTNNNYPRPDSQNCGNFITVSVFWFSAFRRIPRVWCNSSGCHIKPVQSQCSSLRKLLHLGASFLELVFSPLNGMHEYVPLSPLNSMQSRRIGIPGSWEGGMSILFECIEVGGENDTLS